MSDLHMPTLLEFLNRAKETNNTITALTEFVQTANALKTQSAAAEDSLHDEIAETMASLHMDFKQRAAHIKEAISRMKEENQRYFVSCGPDKTYAARTTYLQSLARRLSTAVEEFRRVQSGFAQMQKERLKFQYLIAKPQATEEELTQLEEQEKARPLLQAMFTIGTKSAKEIIIQAEKRRSSIESILKGIEDLKDMSDDFVSFIVSANTEVDKVTTDIKQTAAESKTAQRVINQNVARKIRLKKAKRSALLAFIVLASLTLVYFIVRTQ